MKFLNKNVKIILAITSILLLIIIFSWADYLAENNYIIEYFQKMTAKSHTVNLPLTTTYSCKNFCGPTARCSITGHQCTSDIDCPGCQPYVPPLKSSSKEVRGDNDAGKMTFGPTPRYSALTTDIGTQARLITNNKFSKPSSPYFGVSTWIDDFKKQNKLFDEKFKPPQLEYMPTYDNRYSLSGEFIDNGPLASNAYFS